jgi:hypothetical protein
MAARGARTAGGDAGIGFLSSYSSSDAAPEVPAAESGFLDLTFGGYLGSLEARTCQLACGTT